MTKQFQPKTREEIKTEILTKYKIEDYEANKELVDGLVEDFHKEEEFKTNEKNKTANARKALNDMTKAKEYYKKGGKSKGTPEPKPATITIDDKAYLYGRLGYSRTEVRHLEKVMGITKKPWDKALEDNLFKGWKKDNDVLITRRGSGLPASRGGIIGSDDSKGKDMVNKFSDGLPRGFKLTKPKA